ncbi:putative defensin-like protein 304 [Arabidopsis thaliana]
MKSNKVTFFLGLFLVSAFCKEYVFQRRRLHKPGEWCPVLRVCSYAECICPWGTRSKLPSCQIICAHLDKKSVNSYNPCGCNYK